MKGSVKKSALLTEKRSPGEPGADREGRDAEALAERRLRENINTETQEEFHQLRNQSPLPVTRLLS